MRETGILDKMAQREREGVRYVNVERKEETRTAANNGSASENNGQTETPRILRKLALRGRTGATDASAWLYANANRLEDDAIDSLAREIAARRDSELALRNMSDSLGNYWGQFESEDAYKEALAQQAEYERLLNLDTQALEAEIARKESADESKSELAQMRLDLRNAQSVQTLAQYEKMAQEPGFAERAQEGLAMENPTWQ